MKSVRDRLCEKAERNKFPIMAAMELLPVCNLQCKMCYVRKSMSEVQKAGGLKDVHWWLGIAREAADMGLLYPLLTGGEPFLHPEYKEIHAGLLDMGLQVSINSNATLIDRDLARWLGKHRPLRINVTLYGASEDSYQNLCGHGEAFQKVCNALDLLKEYDVPVKFNASITAENVVDLDKMISFAKNYGSPIQVATYMFPPVRRNVNDDSNSIRLSPEEAALARVRSDYLQNEPQWFMGQVERFSRFIPLQQIDFNSFANTQMHMACRAGVCSAWLDWQGNLANCGMYCSVQLNMASRSFKDCWNELVNKTADLQYSALCAQCPNRKLCHPCVAMINNECGDQTGRPEYVCQMNQAMSRYYQEYARTYYPDMPLIYSITQDSDFCEF